jgi:hypothetical protein
MTGEVETRFSALISDQFQLLEADIVQSVLELFRTGPT